MKPRLLHLQTGFPYKTIILLYHLELPRLLTDVPLYIWDKKQGYFGTFFEDF